MNKIDNTQHDSEIIRNFGFPSADVIADSTLSGWRSLFTVLHKQRLDTDECQRPATAQHQLVLYCGGTESGEVSFNQESWKKYTKRKNEWYIAPAGGSGSVWRWKNMTETDQDSYIFRILLSAQSLADAALQLNADSSINLIPRIGIVDDFMLQLARQLRDEMIAPSLYGCSYGEALSAVLSIHILKNHAELKTIEVPGNGSLSMQKRELVREYIAENLDGVLSLDEMAALVSLSKFHFSRLFKNTFGTAPYRYIYNARMNLLARLLADSDEPLYSLADKVGFSYSTNLIRAFRRFKGVTPMEYRKAIRG